MIKLSHSAVQKYLQSPRYYYNYYILGLREEVLGSALFFGTIVEDGVNVLLKGGNIDEAIEVFLKRMKKKYPVNGSFEDLSSSNKIRYSKNDFQEHLFTENELKDLEGKSQQFKSWISLQKSGELMIREFHENVLPHIKKVLEVQKYIKVENELGDKIIGYADYICEWDDGRILVKDIKTSSVPYKKDCVLTEEKGKQTALYYEVLKDEYKLDGAGFDVLEKKIRKRDPQTRSQIIIDTPPEELIEKTFDESEEVLYNIKQGNFSCTNPSCDSYFGECPYKRFCESGGTDTTGLVQVKKERK